eukprot:Polyplicarium_translucidae@DN1054_c0_g1_i1.p1
MNWEPPENGPSESTADHEVASSGTEDASLIPPFSVPFGEIYDSVSERSRLLSRQQYGMLGILDVVKMTDPALSLLALGTDMTTLGLDISQDAATKKGPLHSRLGSPCYQRHGRKPEEFKIPASYLSQVPPVKGFHFSEFSVPILMYIFYCMPRDLLQGYAAVELLKRGWHYHGVTSRWLMERIGPPDESQPEGSTSWIFFDCNAWAPRPIAGTLTDEERSGFVPVEAVKLSLDNGVRASRQAQADRVLWLQQRQATDGGERGRNPAQGTAAPQGAAPHPGQMPSPPPQGGWPRQPVKN